MNIGEIIKINYTSRKDWYHGLDKVLINRWIDKGGPEALGGAIRGEKKELGLKYKEGI